VFTTPTDATVNGTQGKTVTFAAEARLSGAAYFKKDVTWNVSGNTKTGTTISTTGVLTIAGDEPVGTELTVTATSVADTNKTASKTVKVVAAGYNLTAAEGATFTDSKGVTYRVLHRDNTNHQALVIREYVLPTAQKFDSDSQVWKGSEVETYLNGTYYNSLPADIKDFVKEVTIKTRTSYTGNGFTSSTDKVFLLSEADVFGCTQNGSTATADDYTVSGSKRLFPGADSTRVAKTKSSDSSGVYWWLRSPAFNSVNVALVYGAGARGYGGFTNTYFLRPAFWLNIQ